MALILSVETATEICSVALADAGSLIALEENTEGNRHAAVLTTLVNRVMQKANHSLQDLDAIAISKGPGSYTGLRVGVSTVKGLCYGLGKPLLAVNTLQSLAAHFSNTHELVPGDRLVPMIDARRMEVYCALFDEQMKFLQETEALIVQEESFAQELVKGRLHFFGNGAMKCASVIRSEHAVFHAGIRCSAAGMVSLAERAWEKKETEDVAYFEPFYLKDFMGPKPRKVG